MRLLRTILVGTVASYVAAVTAGVLLQGEVIIKHSNLAVCVGFVAGVACVAVNDVIDYYLSRK